MDPSKNPHNFISRSVLARKTLHFWDRFISSLFSYNGRSYLKGKRVLQSTIPFPEYTSFFHKYSRFGTERGIICTVTDFEEDKKLLSNILSLIAEQYDPPELKELICADLWGKGVSYRALKKGDTFPFFSSSKRKTLRFSLDTEIPLWKDIRAFGFVSQEKEALLLFRGTDISLLSSAGRASMLSDLDPEGPGLAVFHAAQEALSQWLKTQKSVGREVRVIGHSLGGALACYSLIIFPELFSKQCASYATNYPGVNELLLRKWSNIDKKPKFIGVVTDGDAVSKCGYLLDDTSVFVAHRKVPPLQSHELLFGAESSFSLYELNAMDENQSRSRRRISKLHKSASTILYQMGLKHILPPRENGNEV